MSLPGCSPRALSTILELALDLLITEETKRGSGAGKPRKSRETKPGSRHVPVEVQRAVRKRDGDQCTFTDAEGRRCSATRYLTIEHIDPFAKGGPTTVENCCLLCSPHNAHRARQVFGEELHEAAVPEAPWHYDAADCFARRASAGAERLSRPALVLRNLAIRVLEQRPQVGFDPDVCWLEPPPPQGRSIDSLKLWLPGHRAPRLTLEIVSKSHPTKDYAEVPDQCAAVGVEELVVFDPKSLGPRTHGRHALLSVWRWEDGAFERVEAGEQPVKSVVLGAWLVPRLDPPELLIADDPDGLRPWLTPEETERAAKDTERSAKEAEPSAKEAALARVAELERELARRR